MAAQWIELPRRIFRRLAKEARARSGGLDVKWDRLRFRLGRPDGRALAISCARLAPWQVHTQARDIVNGWDGDLRQALVAAAEDACAHRFDLLGSGPYEFGAEIDWHLEFKSGYRWQETAHYSTIRWGGLPPGVDIKVPWELNRCMHFAALGLADLVTGDARYYEEFKRQVRHWIAHNPVGRGVNWTCAMDVGMRAVNWIHALMLFAPRIKDDADTGFFDSLAGSLWHHGLHIRRNLEWMGPRAPSSGNHFLADLTGLLAIGGFFQPTRTGHGWWRFARKWIEREMERQVLDDGCHFETSTSYHRMVMEMFLWARSVTARADEPFGNEYDGKLGRMAEFVEACPGFSGRAAQFGDNDSGRLLWAGVDDGRDHRYLTAGPCEPAGLPNRLLLRGTLPLPEGAGQTDGAFHQGGYYFHGNASAWVGLRAGKVGHGGCHAHCDQLSMVLSVAGNEVLVDRGTGVYTPDIAKRNRYRATAAHNTLSVNGWEQNDFSHERGQVFRMPDHSAAEVTHWEPAAGIWRASHHGFGHQRAGMIHEREVRLDERSLKIHDRVSGARPDDTIEWFFHFAPGLEVMLESERVTIRLPRHEIGIEWDFQAEAGLVDGFHSPAYGVEVPARHLRLACAGGNGGEYRIRIEWREIS